MSSPGFDRYPIAAERYRRLLRKFKALPIKTVHAGHDPSFGYQRLVEIVDRY